MSARAALEAAGSLGALLAARARERPDARALRFPATAEAPPPGLEPDPDGALALSRAELLDLARRAASRLGESVASGEGVVLALPTGPGFAAAFFGCQLLGAVPVAVPARSAPRLRRALELTRARAAVVADGAGGAGDAERIELGELWSAGRARRGARRPDPGAPAFVQLTSGSTGEARGAVISHRAVLANVRAIGERMRIGPADRSCSWLPLFHDLGLVGHLLCPLAFGVEGVLLPPELFARRPLEWLRAMDRYACTISSAPTYAYQLCARRLAPGDVAGLDLSHWRVALCGGEPVQAAALESFARLLEPAAFPATALLPAYGLAEATLAVCMSPPGRGVAVDAVERAGFEREGAAAPARDAAPALEWVSVGPPLHGVEVRIRGGDGSTLGERREGAIEVRGPSLRTLELGPAPGGLSHGWLETGDLGYLARGELFVTGRSKELIAVRGRNIYPHAVEAAAGRVRGVRERHCAAFGAPDAERGTEELVVACEVRDPGRPDELRLAVRRAVVGAVGVRPSVVLLRPGTVPRTSSGKLRRVAVRERFLSGELVDPPSRPGR